MFVGAFNWNLMAMWDLRYTKEIKKENLDEKTLKLKRKSIKLNKFCGFMGTFQKSASIN